MESNIPCLFVVMPAYNEEEVLPASLEALETRLVSMMDSGLIAKNSAILVVDDGSKDKTWDLLKKWREGGARDCHARESNFERPLGHLQNRATNQAMKKTMDPAINLALNSRAANPPAINPPPPPPALRHRS